jgi:hypothetical protein
VKTTLAMTAAAAAVLVLTGCGDNTSPTTTAASSAPVVAASEPEPDLSDGQVIPSTSATFSSPTAASTPADPQLGAVQSFTDWDGDLKVTVLSYKQPVAKSAPTPDQKGYEYGSLVVRVCNDDDHTQTVNTSPFRLLYSDDTEIESVNTGYSQFPQPEFPWGDHSVRAGKCVKGSVVFEVPKRKRPVQVAYNVDSFVDDETLSMTDGSVYVWKL